MGIRKWKVSSLKCKRCVMYEDRFKSLPNFNNSLIKTTKEVKKDSLSKHVGSVMHKEAVKLATRDELGSKKSRKRLSRKVLWEKDSRE